MSSLSAMTHLLQVNAQLDEFREKLNEPMTPLTNDAMLTISTQLQPLYKKLLITNLDEALNRHLESGMWNDCFKTPLTRFGRTDKTLFHMMIETGVGFYLGLIQDIGIHFDISFITNATSTNKLYCTKTSQSPLVSPSKASVYYIIQNCLLHVGDLLRYRGSFPEALKMYEKSAAVCPSNGFPYHQMGITQVLIAGNDDYTTMNNFVSTFYFFARALSVSKPHPQSANAFDSIISKIMSVPVGTNKYQEFIRQFLLMIASTLRKDQFTVSSSCSNNVVPMLSPLVTNQQIKPSILFQIIIIALWAHWRQMNSETSTGAEELTLELICGILNSILIAAIGLFGTGAGDSYAHNNLDKRFYCIPHFKLLLDWILRLQQNEKSTKQLCLIRERIHVGTLVKLLNQIKGCTQDGEGEDDLKNSILPEEKRLIGFLPLDYSSIRAPGDSLLDETNPKTQKHRLNRLAHVASKLAISNSAGQSFIGFDGLNFTEPASLSASPVSLKPSSRNVALTSIFRSQSMAGIGFDMDLGASSPMATTPISMSLSISSCGSSNNNNNSTPNDIFRSIWTPDSDTRDSTWN